MLPSTNITILNKNIHKVLQKENRKISSRRLVMSLFNSPNAAALNIKQLIAVANIFDIETSALRMAVSRLIKEQLIENPERGVYRAGARAISLNSEIQSWRIADKKMKEWNGEWSMALTGHLGRTNKTQLRSMAKAFELYGFVEIETGVWIRPANLVLNIQQLKLSLVKIGMDSKTHLISVNEVADPQRAWHSNWPVATLEKRYVTMTQTLSASQVALKQMSNQDAAKESLVIGESAIRLINLDPLLPKQLINAELFKDLVAQMIAYDKIGQLHWQRFLAS